ncbi:unnamed protein product, partial [Leptidea sinapis]
PAFNVSIYWVHGTLGDALQAGKPAVAKCIAHGSHPQPDVLWWLDHKHLTQHSNQSLDKTTRTAISFLELTPSVSDNGATLACIATNSAMTPGRDSKADVVVLNYLGEFHEFTYFVHRRGYQETCREILLRSYQCVKETLKCNINALPAPDTYFWHIQSSGEDVQHLTTGSPLLPLTQISGGLLDVLDASCEAGNGIASQDKPCRKLFSLEQLRPPQPQQCDLAYEYEEFQMRCVPERRRSMGFGVTQALAQGGGIPWLVRGPLGTLKIGDEAGASACNRYGCSRALLLRPTENLLHAAAGPWWKFLLEKDVGISVGATVLVVAFLASTAFLVRLIRRSRSKPPVPVIQVLQLDDVARDYLDTIGEHKVRASCSLRSCSSGYSDGSTETAPTVDRRRKPRTLWGWDQPPPDVTLTLHRESAV